LGWWDFGSCPEQGAAPDATGTFAKVAGEVTATIRVEVAVKEPKQISTGSARMSTMLTGQKMPDRAATLHSEFRISPT
jgi:hypothetical protein